MPKTQINLQLGLIIFLFLMSSQIGYQRLPTRQKKLSWQKFTMCNRQEIAIQSLKNMAQTGILQTEKSLSA